MLTRKQYELLTFIHSRVQREGVSPSFDEMKAALDLRSKSGIHRLITALEERGFIRRLPHRARAIEIVRLPDNMEPKSGRSFRPSVIEGRAGQDDPSRNADVAIATLGGRQASGDSDVRAVPLVGRIAAGQPIEALQQGAVQIGVPSMMISGSSEHYALEVKGDSMIDAGIHEGDLVVIRSQSTANNGDIVVALIDDHEATLKRLRRKGGTVALEAANPAYETRLYRSDQVKIQGRLVGLTRTY